MNKFFTGIAKSDHSMWKGYLSASSYGLLCLFVTFRCHMNNVPICLMYGKEDPWVKPVWGRQVKKQVPEAPYYEISPAGHCPHDEVPEVYCC